MPVGTDSDADTVTDVAASSAAADATSPDDDVAEDNDDELTETGHETADDKAAELPPSKRQLRLPRTPHCRALLVGVPLIAVLWSIAGWLGWQRYETHRVADEHAQLLQAARQGALNMTTIDWQHPDADVQRILD